MNFVLRVLMRYGLLAVVGGGTTLTIAQCAADGLFPFFAG